MLIKHNFVTSGLLFLILILAVEFHSQTINLKIIETSDVHGALLPYDILNDSSTNSSLAQVHSYVLGERLTSNQQVVLLDNGDILQGDPMAYYYNYIDTTDIHVFADAMNFMQYDAATVGNHDIETGHRVYDKFRKEINFPWLAANAVDKETGESYFQPYTVIVRGGIKIAILGLITPAIPNWLPEILYKGIEFEDMIESAEKWVQIIKEKEKPDLLIGLFHSGVNYTYNEEDEDTYRNENASQLVAEQVTGFDIVFVGHDHAVWNFKIENSNGDSVLILGPSSRAKTVTAATIQLEYDSLEGKWMKKNISGEIVDIKNYKPDDHFMSKFLFNLNVVENYTQTPIGQITKSISSRESLFGPSEFVDLIQTAQLEITGADISFSEPLNYNSTIDSGWIRVGDLFKLYHYENYLYTMRLTGKEIKKYLEFSFGNWFNQMSDGSDNLLKFKNNDDGSIKYSLKTNLPELDEVFYNFSSAAGINYIVDVSKRVGKRVTITTLSNGTSFSPDSVYTVAVNSYRGNGGGGHLIRGAGIPKEELSERILSSTDKDLRYNIMKWIESKKIINPVIIGNWKIIPPEWWKKGKERDFELLFGSKPNYVKDKTNDSK
jgi:2',3'-cyclic-nucleotide 2'-phosphodiesterase/3'-nucleotidase